MILESMHKKYMKSIWFSNISTLKLLGDISINHKGKDECIKEHVIDASWPYLSSEFLQERIYAAFVLMSCGIHLHGKYQIVQKESEDGGPIIIQVYDK